VPDKPCAYDDSTMTKPDRSTQELRGDFAVAHQEGMAALRDGDYDGFGEAIQREAEIISEHQELIDHATSESGQNARPTPQKPQ
jgi:hypothetical protein